MVNVLLLNMLREKKNQHWPATISWNKFHPNLCPYRVIWYIMFHGNLQYTVYKYTMDATYHKYIYIYTYIYIHIHTSPKQLARSWGPSQTDMNHLPTIHFQVRAFSFRENIDIHISYIIYIYIYVCIWLYFESTQQKAHRTQLSHETFIEILMSCFIVVVFFLTG